MKIFLALFSLGAGGKTKAVFNQANTLSGKGHDVTIITFAYHRNFTSRVEQHHERRELSSNVKVINPYEDLERRMSIPNMKLFWNRNRSRTPTLNKRADISVKGLLVQEDSIGNDKYFRCFAHDGTYVKYLRWNSAGKLVRATYFRQRKPYLRREYAPGGYCYLEIDLDTNERVVQQRYLTEDGFCYLSRWLDPDTGDLQAVFVNSRRRLSSTRYNNDVGWHVDWLREQIAKSDEKPVIVAHSSGVARRLLRISKLTAYRIFQWHENHLSDPMDPSSEIRDDYKDVFARFHEMDSVVVATRKQANDLSLRYSSQAITSIPAYITADTSIAQPTRQPYKVGVFARLVPGKQVDQLIRIAPRIKKAHEEFTLEIYGDGQESGSLKKLTQELGASDYVIFHGAVKNAEKEMATCALTCSTSRVESFGLSIAESLTVGTPVIAYDINYGPSDLIENGYNGWLLTLDDSEALGQRIIKALGDQKTLANLSSNARNSMKAKYTVERYAQKWSDLLDNIQAQESQ